MKERDVIPEYEMGKEQGTGNREPGRRFVGDLAVTEFC
jgi:hypothetical protein